MPAKLRSEELANQATFVFQGTSMRVRAATLKEVPVSDRIVVVRVDRVIHAPETLSDYAGQDITVQLATGEKVKPRQTLIFLHERLHLWRRDCGSIDRPRRGLGVGDGGAEQLLRRSGAQPADTGSAGARCYSRPHLHAYSHGPVIVACGNRDGYRAEGSRESVDMRAKKNAETTAVQRWLARKCWWSI